MTTFPSMLRASATTFPSMLRARHFLDSFSQSSLVSFALSRIIRSFQSDSLIGNITFNGRVAEATDFDELLKHTE